MKYPNEGLKLSRLSCFNEYSGHRIYSVSYFIQVKCELIQTNFIGGSDGKNGVIFVDPSKLNTSDYGTRISQVPPYFKVSKLLLIIGLFSNLKCYGT